MKFFDKIKNVFNKKEEVLYDKGLEKTRDTFVSSLNKLSIKYKSPNEEYFEELEEILITADIGVKTVLSFMDRLRSRVKKENISNLEELQELIVDELFIIYVEDDVISTKLTKSEEGPTVVLFVGVNGVGKTTTIAKVANILKNDGNKVLLVAADTFRAGAVEQLKQWGSRVGATVISDESTKDPSAVVYKGIDLALREEYDYVLIDTAGRLQNKVNLMNELDKMNKVIGKLIPDAPHETLLVIDATTGQNGINQVKSFKEITNVTGLVLTKLDGTAKGGIVLAIKEELNVPVKFIGLGEKIDDLSVFDIEKYIYGLFKGMV
jgi:fused signal recognition particle receptor